MKLKDIDAPLLVYGEKGVGKSLYSKIVHIEGQRGLSNFEIINCQEREMNKLYAELFGPNGDDCKLIKCQGGSVQLDEIWALPLELQKSLCTVLKEKHIPETKYSVDIRIIATSTKDLSELVTKGEFDPQFYEYLSKAIIHIDPLRRRSDDIELLVDYFLKVECKKQGLLLKSFSPKLIEKLKKYDWPGNIKELRLSVERAVLYNPKAHIITDIDISDSASPLVDLSVKKRMFGDLPFVSDHAIALKDRMAIVEREMIHSEIRRNNGNKSKAAKEMGISREALRKKLLMSTEILKNLNLSEEEKMRIEKEDNEFNKAA
jgi:Nif-specific regulatory protein